MSIDVSPDGNTIVFDMLGDLYTLPMSGGTATRLTSGMAFDSHPRFSPDGKSVAYISDKSGGENLWRINLEDKEETQISKGATNMMQSADWTPDGDYLVASKGGVRRLGLPKLWLFHKDGGSGKKMISEPDRLKTVEPAVSPDGRYIWHSRRMGAWQYNARMPQYQLAIYDRENGTTETMTSRYGSAFTPTLSSDGKYLVYGSRFEDQTGLVLRDLQSGEEKWLAYPVQRDEQESRATMDVLPGMSFTPDNQFLVTSYGGKIYKIPVSGGAAVNIPFEVDVELDLGPLLDFDYPISDDEQFVARQIRDTKLSPDGTKMAFTVLDRLYLMDYPSGTPKRLTSFESTEAYPTWSPDGKWIAFVTWETGGGSVYKVNIEGRPRPVELTSRKAVYQQPVWASNDRIVFIQGPAQRFEDAYSPFSPGVPAEIAWVSSSGGSATVIDRTKGRHTPHFGKNSERIYMTHSDKGLISIRWDGTDEKSHIKVTGIKTYGAKDPSKASTLLISPKGDEALAQVNNDIYVVTIPYVGGETTTISVSDPAKSAFPARQVTSMGGHFPSWNANGDHVHFSLGNAFFDYDIGEAISFEDSVKAAKKAEKEKKEEKKEEDEVEKEEDKDEEANEDKKEEKDDAYGASEIRVKVLINRDLPGGSVLLSGARIISMKGEEIIESGDILIEGNRIKAIGAKGSLEVPSGTTTRDLTGKTIIPGFVDTHAHMWPEWGLHKKQVWMYAANLAYGVTTTRDPQTATTDVLTYADHVRAGNMVGPRVYSTGPGVGFWANNIKSLEHARKILKQYSEYYDTKTIKMYVVGNRQQRQWVIQAAHEQKLMPTTEGALNMKMDMTHIIDGYPGHEHSFPIYPLYKDVIQFVSQAETTYTPTMLVAYGGPWAENYYYATEVVHDDPKLSRFTAHQELDQKSRRRNGWFMKEEHVFEELGEFVKDLVEAGGYAGVGSHGQLQGLGYHWELWSMQAGGLAIHDALKVATIHGAKGIGLENDLGTLEPGKLADLVVLDANPLDDIRNTNKIYQVMKNGRLYDASTLDEVYPDSRKLDTSVWDIEKPEGLFGHLGVCQTPGKHRMIVLTDIEADPDDTQTLVRLLLYANQIDIKGLVATTSTHMRDQVYPESIEKVIDAYGKVQNNLLLHEPGYPEAEALQSIIKSGPPVYGMEGVGDGRDTEGSDRIIKVLEEDDDRPLWISVWGGPNVLAQALFKLKETKSERELKNLVSKLRVYTISDQDDSAIWIRNNFPDLFYVVSPGGYFRATWIGITQRIEGINNSTISNSWLAQNIQQDHGPLGARYPDVGYGMEGDTPAWLSLIQNGLNDPENPNMGGWGGRYELYLPAYSTFENSGFTGGVPIEPETRAIWTNVDDEYQLYVPNDFGRTVRKDSVFKGNQVTLWRWRDDFQNDFAARMDWCLQTYEEANHPPVPVLNHAEDITVNAGEGFHLDATGTYDPDDDNLSYLWFPYPEIGTYGKRLDIEHAENLIKVYIVAPKVDQEVTTQFVLKVSDKGSPPISRYKRVHVTIKP
ncbi:tolB [Symbiodinium microadriaticum]|nr:tolB [Symbiodinium microadriaticum]